MTLRAWLRVFDFVFLSKEAVPKVTLEQPKHRIGAALKGNKELSGMFSLSSFAFGIHFGFFYQVVGKGKPSDL